MLKIANKMFGTELSFRQHSPAYLCSMVDIVRDSAFFYKLIWRGGIVEVLKWRHGKNKVEKHCLKVCSTSCTYILREYITIVPLPVARELWSPNSGML